MIIKCIGGFPQASHISISPSSLGQAYNRGTGTLRRVRDNNLQTLCFLGARQKYGHAKMEPRRPLFHTHDLSRYTSLTRMGTTTPDFNYLSTMDTARQVDMHNKLPICAYLPHLPELKLTGCGVYFSHIFGS